MRRPGAVLGFLPLRVCAARGCAVAWTCEPIKNNVDTSEDGIFDLPWIFAGFGGDWEIAPSVADRLGKTSNEGYS
jgi:hypothetical protein